MKIISLPACLLFFGLAMNVNAQEKSQGSGNSTEDVNSVDVKGPHQLSVTQSGKGNSVLVDQKGGTTTVKSNQNVTVVTSKNGNTIISTMDADTSGHKNNVVHIRQSGSGNRSTVIQTGNGNRSTIYQSPSEKQNN